MKRLKMLLVFLIIVTAGVPLILTGCAKKAANQAIVPSSTGKLSKSVHKKKIKIKKPLLTPASYHGFFNNKVIKVVFQVSSPNPKKWKTALLNMNDIIWELHYNPKKYRVVLVAYGPADKMFLKKNNKLESIIEKLYKHKVKFEICHVAMIKLGIKSDDIFPFVHITPDGFFSIIHYEMTGYSYIKP
jgi:intracellular sulfur oxidation DsrE/DsrF family protein